ncbi:DUF397 domain-containing protein [Nonomuraea sp. NPDC051941]|uniref:DUF397 domain-containing protein n=1 Tax=Nonomuraea sp. NPDC051941 TaxID=3364373 RepID=UPI0037CB4F80
MSAPPQLRWFKSTFSSYNGNCVEVATLASGNIGVRDSKDPHGPVLEFSAEEWAQLLSAIKSSGTKGSS